MSRDLTHLLSYCQRLNYSPCPSGTLIPHNKPRPRQWINFRTLITVLTVPFTVFHLRSILSLLMISNVSTSSSNLNKLSFFPCFVLHVNPDIASATEIWLHGSAHDCEIDIKRSNQLRHNRSFIRRCVVRLHIKCLLFQMHSLSIRYLPKMNSGLHYLLKNMKMPLLVYFISSNFIFL